MWEAYKIEEYEASGSFASVIFLYRPELFVIIPGFAVWSM